MTERHLHVVRDEKPSRAYRAGFVLGEVIVWVVAVALLGFLVHLLW
jgi:hypothetical protein